MLPARREGLLDEQQEQNGRRRKVYRLTEAGRRALDDWRAEPAGEPFELRDPGMLKLVFGADPGPLAETQLAFHEQRLETYRGYAALDDARRHAPSARMRHQP